VCVCVYAHTHTHCTWGQGRHETFGEPEVLIFYATGRQNSLIALGHRVCLDKLNGTESGVRC